MTTRKTGWLIAPPLPEAASLHATIGGHPLTAYALAQRGIVTPDAAAAFLDPTLYSPAPPSDLPDLIAATTLLDGAIATRKKILIWGDFDVDGQTATALLLDGLRKLGAEVDYFVPLRLRDSHGIPVARLEEVIAQKQPAVLLTCDTGVSAHAAVEYANRHGLTVIITDHHALPPALPPAAAIVNPQRLPPDHRLRSLPGVGVAFKLIQALYENAGRDSELDSFLDLVALGIVADVAVQTHDTRYLLQKGLRRLRSTQRLGIRALIEAAGLEIAHISTEDVGFQLGPRLNAAGRLDDAAQAIDLLTTTDPTQARVLAARLDGLNKTRQVLQRQILASAQEMIGAQPELLEHGVLVLSHPEWHAGLLGIVAGQLAEYYDRPCILLVTPAGESLARGSARSVPGFDIGQALAEQADLLESYGGHPGAAGLSLHIENIPRLRRRLSQAIRLQMPQASTPPLEVVAEIDLAEATPELAADLERLAPFGEGNPPVVLAATDLALMRHRVIGLERRHRRLTVRSEPGVERTVLWWNGAEHPLPDGTFDLAFTLQQRMFQGEQELVLILEGLRLREPVQVNAAPQQTITDWRTRTTENDAVEAFRQQEPGGLIWAEGEVARMVSACNRLQLTRTEALLIYTTPPSPEVLHQALAKAKPQRLYLLGVPPNDPSAQAFLRRLLGLAKYAINHKAGRVEFDHLAAATAQTEIAVRWGLRLLAAKGVILLDEQETEIRISPAQTDPASNLTDTQEAADALRAALAETAAYRAFFSRAAPDNLLT